MTTTLVRPTGYPEWGASAGASGIVQPTTAQQNSGWLGNVKPKAQYQNWLSALTNQWAKYLDRRWRSVETFSYYDAGDSIATNGAQVIGTNMKAMVGASGIGVDFGVQAPGLGTWAGPSCRFRPSTGASGLAGVQTGGRVVIPGSSTSEFRMDVRVALDVAGANRQTVTVGLVGLNSTPVEQVVFTKGPNDTNWFCQAAAPGEGVSGISADSGVAPVAATAQRLTLQCYATGHALGPRALFYVDDVKVAEIATGLPGAVGGYLCAFVQNSMSGSTGGAVRISPVAWSIPQ